MKRALLFLDDKIILAFQNLTQGGDFIEMKFRGLYSPFLLIFNQNIYCSLEGLGKIW